MINNIQKFGVRQRCMKGGQSLWDLMATALHYKRDMNFYIYENDWHFLGTINRQVLLKHNIDNEDRNLRLQDICVQDWEGIVRWTEDKQLIKLLNDAFMDHPIEEAVIVDEKTGRMTGIINRREFFNEALLPTPEDDEEMICYREFSHYYDTCRSGLNQYAYNVNSQHGEDGILKAIFDKIGTTSKYAVEFGGWDGIYLSNIRELIVRRGFAGLFIEGDRERAEKLRSNYADYPRVACVEAFVGFRTNTLDSILRDNHAPEQIDVLSIDIDGYDYHVWDALQDYRPRIVIIEYNPSIPNDIVVINPHKEDIFTGSSAAALVELGRRKGYSLIAVTQTNLLFIVNEEYDKLEIWDNELSELRSVDRLSDGRYFQTYDKKIVLTGHNAYIWSGEAFEGGENKYYFSNI